jgi:beta-1,2-mannobiose phosphorylase / 1,2-beta-oligomannan phosphorylase
MKYVLTIVMLITATQTICTAEEVNIESFVTNGVMMFADTSRDRPFAKDPAVVRFKDQYFMYYSVPPGKNIAGWRIGIATSKDLLTWKKREELKISHESEKNGFCAPGAIVLNGKVHLFYQTYGNGRNDAICHAWSDDGFSFSRNPSNPIFRPTGSWCSGRAIDADVIEHDGKLLLYYATRDPRMEIQMLGVAAAPIGSDFGRDKWTQLNTDGPILRPELFWEKKCIEAAALCKHGDKLYMFYAGGYNNQPQQIGCAVSSDGVSWKRLFNQPIIPNGKKEEWNASESGHPYAFTDQDGVTYLFYQGNNDNGKTWYLSKVKIGWKGDLPFVETKGSDALQQSPGSDSLKAAAGLLKFLE